MKVMKLKQHDRCLGCKGLGYVHSWNLINGFTPHCKCLLGFNTTVKGSYETNIITNNPHKIIPVEPCYKTIDNLELALKLARKYHIMNTIKENSGQLSKFKQGDVVYIKEIKDPCMKHFPCKCYAIVNKVQVYKYNRFKNIENDYGLDIISDDIKPSYSAWYKEHQLKKVNIKKINKDLK
jgi:hypothetical protein